MERLSGKKNYLGTFFGSCASLKDGQYLLQESFKETNSNINKLGFCCIYGKANSQAFRKAKTKTLNKKQYEVC